MSEENKTYDEINVNKYTEEKVNEYYAIKDNGILLISEIQNKVILPYKAEEVEKLLKDEKYKDKTPEEVIESEFTRPLSDYKDLHVARMKESIKLLTQRDEFSRLDGINLGLELFGKRYLHPAIISACKNLDELNVYLDCLDKNELEDFKVFEIKYELYPAVINENSGIFKIKKLWQKIKNIVNGVNEAEAVEVAVIENDLQK